MSILMHKYLLGVSGWKEIMEVPKLWLWKLSSVTCLHWKAHVLECAFRFLYLVRAEVCI